MENIPFLDLKPDDILSRELSHAYDKVIRSGQYIGGKEVEYFEKEWAEYCHVKYCIGVGNGFDALYLCCKFMRIENLGVTIYTPWKTCLPTWAAVYSSGNHPNPFEHYSCMAYIAVHIYGHITLPDFKNKPLIEDCAQAHGSCHNGIPAGKFGQMAAWSFYPTKNLGAYGDAGAITTDREDIYKYMISMRSYGKPDNAGINSRLDPMQAAYLRVKLKYLDRWNKRRAANAQAYLSEIEENDCIKLPKYNANSRPNWHIFAIEVENRESLREYLKSCGVETMVHYDTLPYPRIYKIYDAENWARTTLSLPIAPHVTPEQCRKIARQINIWSGETCKTSS